MVLEGLATEAGTAAFAKAHAAAAGHYREWNGLTLSSVGMGTYLGEETDEADRGFTEAARAYLSAGTNVLDTAVNYRSGRSERALGAALAAHGRREEVVVATKGGFISPEPGTSDPRAWFRETYVKTGILAAPDVVGGIHAMSPAYLRHELGRSLRNLALDAVDVYFVHNPEMQLMAGVPRAEFESRLRTAFEALEAEADAGRIGAYGLATWDGLRVQPAHPAHLSLERALALATEARAAVGTGPHHLRAIELPVNLAMTEGSGTPTQPWRGGLVPAAVAAADAGMLVLASASLMQRHLVGRIPDGIRAVLAEGTDDVRAALQFARSAPGVTTALVGTGSPAHAIENARLARSRPMRDVVARLLA